MINTDTSEITDYQQKRINTPGMSMNVSFYEEPEIV